MTSLHIDIPSLIQFLTLVSFGVAFLKTIWEFQQSLDRRLDDLSGAVVQLAHRVELDEQATTLAIKQLGESLDDIRLAVTAQANQLNSKIDHRSAVFQDQIDQLNEYLATRTDFQVRRRSPKNHPPAGG